MELLIKTAKFYRQTSKFTFEAVTDLLSPI